MTIFACTDIHGQYDAWIKAMNNSNLDLDNGDELIILGDLIDRGPKSLECVANTFLLMDKYPEQITYLKGNHEHMMLDFLNLDITDDNKNEPFMRDQTYMKGGLWFQNGGFEAVKSFMSDDEFEIGEPLQTFRYVHEQLNTKFPKLIDRLNNLPLNKIDHERNIAYVHAGFAPYTELNMQTEEAMLWIREDFIDHFEAVPGDVLDGMKIIHGHTPVEYIKDYNGKGYYQGKHGICIDGGAAAEHNILMLNVDDMSYTETPIMEKFIINDNVNNNNNDDEFEDDALEL